MKVLLVAIAVGACSYYMPEGQVKSGDDAVGNVGPQPSILFYGCDEASGDEIDLDTHEGLICLEEGSFFTLKVTPVTYEEVPQNTGDKQGGQSFLGEVTLAIVDGDGNDITGALLMWHKTELQAKVVKGVAHFNNLFIPRDLPEDAQLLMKGANRTSSNSSDSYAFDIATEFGSGLGFTINSILYLERFPLIYNWYLGYWPQLEYGSVVDWYIETGKSSSGQAQVSKLLQQNVTKHNYYRRGNDTNPSLDLRADQTHPDDEEGDDVLRELPSCYRLVTKITTQDVSASPENNDSTTNDIAKIAVNYVGTGCVY